MTLTAEQEAKRVGKLTASRVGVLMRGDAAGIDRLYREMIGELAEEDLSDNWAVQRGLATEMVNLRWYEKKSHSLVTRRRQVVTSEWPPWAACTLDGWDSILLCPIECKDVGGREPIEIIIDRYQPQMQWQMLVTGAKQCALSCIIAGNVPVVDYIPRDDAYIGVLLERAEYFMMCVELRKPPVAGMPPVQPPVPTRSANMTGNNSWANNAFTFNNCQRAHEEYEDAKAMLKSLLPADAARAFGHGVKVTRDRANRIHVRRDE